MNLTHWKTHLKSFDERRDIVCPGDAQATIKYAIEHFITIGQECIESNGVFNVALSGGSTPKAIYEGLATGEYSSKLDWSRVQLFWGDERCVPPTDSESNYHMAMTAGFKKLKVPPENIHRMIAEGDIELEALAYENLIKEKIPHGSFDLIMLGMGDDGHTASLFPKTHGLHAKERLVIANFVPQKEVWRMSLTYKCINAGKNIGIYVLGTSKAAMVRQVLYSPYNPDELPIQKIGTETNKALWIMDQEAFPTNF